MFKKRLSLPNCCIRLCVRGKRIDHGIGYGLEIPAEYMFYASEKVIQWAKKTIDGVDSNVKRKF